MRKFTVLEPLKHGGEYLLQGDELLLISEFQGASGGNSCRVANKRFCNPLNRKEIIIYMGDFNKIKEIL